MASNSLTTLQLDEQLIYVGTIVAGFLSFLFKMVFTTQAYNTQNSELINNTVLCFEKGDDGYWIGTEGGLVNWNKSSSVNDDVINVHYLMCTKTKSSFIKITLLLYFH